MFQTYTPRWDGEDAVMLKGHDIDTGEAYYSSDDVDEYTQKLQAENAALRAKLAEAESKASLLTHRRSRAMEFAAEKHARLNELRAKMEELRDAFSWWIEVSDGCDENGWSFWISEDADDELEETHTAAWANVERLLTKGEE